MNVQGYILSLSTPNTVEEIRERIATGTRHNIDNMLYHSDDGYICYTAPLWIMAHDIVFFYHTKSAIRNIRAVRKAIEKECKDEPDYMELREYVEECERLYNRYGGKIYAVGTIAEDAFLSDSGYEHPHYKSRIFAPIKDVTELQYPIRLEDFEKVCPLGRQQTITPVFGDNFINLKKMIVRDNNVPCLRNKTSVHIPIKDANKGNWLSIANECERRYILEAQFRKYYADYFLSCMSDDGKIYMECDCYKGGKRTGIADYFIIVGGKYAPVEAKLFLRDGVLEQLKKYVGSESVRLFKDKTIDKDMIHEDLCYAIDRNGFYGYDPTINDNAVFELVNFDDLRSMADVRRAAAEL